MRTADRRNGSTLKVESVLASRSTPPARWRVDISGDRARYPSDPSTREDQTTGGPVVSRGGSNNPQDKRKRNSNADAVHPVVPQSRDQSAFGALPLHAADLVGQSGLAGITFSATGSANGLSNERRGEVEIIATLTRGVEGVIELESSLTFRFDERGVQPPNEQRHI